MWNPKHFHTLPRFWGLKVPFQHLTSKCCIILIKLHADWEKGRYSLYNLFLSLELHMNYNQSVANEGQNCWPISRPWPQSFIRWVVILSLRVYCYELWEFFCRLICFCFAALTSGAFLWALDFFSLIWSPGMTVNFNCLDLNLLLFNYLQICLNLFDLKKNVHIYPLIISNIVHCIGKWFRILYQNHQQSVQN